MSWKGCVSLASDASYKMQTSHAGPVLTSRTGPLSPGALGAASVPAAGLDVISCDARCRQLMQGLC